jgi:hypothetical protein
MTVRKNLLLKPGFKAPNANAGQALTGPGLAWQTFFTYQCLLGCGMGNLCQFMPAPLPVLQAQIACL